MSLRVNMESGSTTIYIAIGVGTNRGDAINKNKVILATRRLSRFTEAQVISIFYF